MCQSSIGALDAEESRPPAAARRPVALQQPVLAHQPLHPLAVHRAGRDRATGQRGDHPGAVGRVLARDAEDRLLGARQRPPLALRRPLRAAVDRLAADPGHRATSAAGRPCATSSRDRATRMLTPSPSLSVGVLSSGGGRRVRRLNSQAGRRAARGWPELAGTSSRVAGSAGEGQLQRFGRSRAGAQFSFGARASHRVRWELSRLLNSQAGRQAARGWPELAGTIECRRGRRA